MEDAIVIPTAEEVAAKKKQQARQGSTLLLSIVGAAFFATPLSIACFAVLAVMWRGRALGMAALFALATTLAFFATKSSTAGPDSMEKWIGKADKAALAAASGGAPPATTAGRAAAAPASHAAPAYRVIEVKNGATIRGIVRISEARPVWKIEPFKDQNLGCGKEHPTERLVVGEDRALGNAVVFLREVKAGKAWPEKWRPDDRTALIDQKGCVYLPHVQWIPAKTQLAVQNSDAAAHNIHGYMRDMGSTQFNFSSGPGSLKNDVESALLETPASYIVKCDIHPWMSAYVQVSPHPYCEVTSAEATATRKAGEYVLEVVPPGTYDVVCWHEGMREEPVVVDGKISAYLYGDPEQKIETVTVKAGETKGVDFTIPAPPPR